MPSAEAQGTSDDQDAASISEPGLFDQVSVSANKPKPPSMPKPSKEYIQRFKAGRVKLDWDKLARLRVEAQRPEAEDSGLRVSLADTGISAETEEIAEGDEDGEDEGEELAYPVATDDSEPRRPITLELPDVSDVGARLDGASETSESPGPSSMPTIVEVVHTCTDGSKLTLPFKAPGVPHKVVHSFNKDAKRAVKLLCQGGSVNGPSADPGKSLRPYSYEEIAFWLLTEQGLSKNKVGDYLGTSDELAVATLDAFVAALKPHFVAFSFDEAMRFFLSLFRLPGEAQQIARILEKFATAFAEAHPTTFKSVDCAYVLAYSLIMLNVDAHSDQVTNKMTLDQFVSNNRGIDGGEDLPRQLLTDLYHSIVKNEIRIEQREYISAVTEGWLYKQGGRVKTWKKRYIILSGNVLYYYKTPKDREPLGFVPLEDISVSNVREKATFIVTPSTGAMMKSVHLGKGSKGASGFEKGHHKSFLFRANSTSVAQHWVDAIIEHEVKTNAGLRKYNADHSMSSCGRDLSESLASNTSQILS
mmetsp:Transcript_5747/g.9637  ORF Transcript_5747/g.9637 Transcript_5747/m.9637 type:complete len:531 (-) Transcript_5747:100-1692(-)